MICRRTSGLPKWDVVFPTLLYSDSWCSQGCHRRSQVLPDLLSALTGLLPASPGGPRCTLRPLCWSSQLWDLTTLGFWSDNSQTLPEAPCHIISFCWWNQAIGFILRPSSPVVALISIGKKKDSGLWLCVDYRAPIELKWRTNTLAHCFWWSLAGCKEHAFSS